MALEKEYEVLCTLGEGSFGKVSKARHRETGDDVAVKEIKVGAKSFNEALNSMELKALKALRHPCIVRLRELLRSQIDGSLFFIFEFVASDLGRVIKENPSGLPEVQATELMRQLLVGIAHIHQHGFFHRDLKPDNILFDPAQQSIRIADFGESRSLRARPPFTDYVGTRWYRAPECLLRDGNYSSPVDVWAAGLVFAEVLRGQPVFKGTGSIDQLHQIFAVLGLPSLAEWPEFKRLSTGIRIRLPEQGPCGLQRVLPSISPKVQAAIAEILIVFPKKRPPARRCLEAIEIFARLQPLDMLRLDSNGPSSTDTSRLEDDRTPLADRTPMADRTPLAYGADIETTPPPSAPRPQGFGFGIAGYGAPAEPVDLDQDLDLDAELDEILADSPKRPNGMRPAANNVNQASVTSLLGSFSFLPSSRTPSRLSQNDGATPDPVPGATPDPAPSQILAGYASHSPNFAPASPSGNIEALLASMEADLHCNRGGRRSSSSSVTRMAAGCTSRPDRSPSPNMPDIPDSPLHLSGYQG